MKIKNSEVETAPFTNLVITKKGEHFAELRQFWTVRAGMYGHQVACQLWVDGEYSEIKTNGCGYCKDQSTFNDFLIALFNKYFSYGGGCEYLLKGTKYHKGGNYYEIPLLTLKKLVSK